MPTMIRSHELRDVSALDERAGADFKPETWAREHLHMDTPMDMHLACSLE